MVNFLLNNVPSYWLIGIITGCFFVLLVSVLRSSYSKLVVAVLGIIVSFIYPVLFLLIFYMLLVELGSYIKKVGESK